MELNSDFFYSWTLLRRTALNEVKSGGERERKKTKTELHTSLQKLIKFYHYFAAVLPFVIFDSFGLCQRLILFSFQFNFLVNEFANYYFLFLPFAHSRYLEQKKLLFYTHTHIEFYKYTLFINFYSRNDKQ